MKADEITKFDLTLVRNQRTFLVFVSLFVLCSCFVYGLTIGSRESVAVAMAKRGPAPAVSSLGNAEDLAATAERLSLVPALAVSSMGNEMRINGRVAGMWSVGSNAAAKELLIEQEQRWKSLGFVTEGVVTSKRGVLLGRDGPGGSKLMLTVWRVLPGIRARTGLQTQGFLAEMGGNATADLDEAKLPTGIAPRPGGKGGAIVSSLDEVDKLNRPVKTQSVVFSNPGTLRENLDYYRDTLSDLGWSAVSGSKTAVGPTLYLQKGEQELLLVAAPLKNSSMIDGSGTQVFFTLFESSTADSLDSGGEN